MAMNTRGTRDGLRARWAQLPWRFGMLAWGVLLLSVADPAAAAISARPVGAEGIAGGRPVRIEVIVAADSTAPESVVREIAVRGARTAGIQLSDDFFFTGAVNPQFMDRRRDNDYLSMSYNPAGEPVANTVTALRNAQAKWSSIAGSAFRFRDGGLTARVPAIFDGHDDIGWLPMGATPYGAVLGLTIQVLAPGTGTFYEADITMNSDLGGFGAWSIDPAQPGPPATYDVESVLLHELGHVAGLAHSPNPEAVMFYAAIAIARELTSTEQEGMRYLYPRQPVALGSRPPDKHNLTSLAEFEEAPYLGVGGLDKYGSAAFVATVSSEPYGEGLFLSSKAGPVELLRTGDVVAGLTMGSGSIEAPTINGPGDIAVAWLLSDDFLSPFGANAVVLRRRAQGGFGLVVDPGTTQAPGGGEFFGAFGLGSDDVGNLVFGGYVSGPLGLRRGVFVAKRDGGFEAVMRPGDAAPGGGIFVEGATPSISARGNYVTFAANLADTPGQAIFLKSRETGALVSVLRPGSLALGGGTVIDLSTPRVNSSGEVVFGAVVSRPYEPLHTHVYRYSDGTLEAIARTGDLLPDGWTFRDATDGTWGVNDSGNVVFTAMVETISAQAAAVFTSSNNTLTRVSRDGDVVFGAGALSDHRSSVIGPRSDIAFVTRTPWTRDRLLRASPQALK